jgi:hypothetical protein
MFHTTTTHFSPALPALPSYPRLKKRAYAPPTPDASDSEYSDREYRSSLVIGRKRGRSEYSDSDDDSDIVRGRGGGGKRRIIDVMGGVLRGAWKMLSTPFVAMPAPPVTVERVVPTPTTQGPTRTWDSYAQRTWDPQPLRTWEHTPPSSAGSSAGFEDNTCSAQQWIMVSPRTTPSPTTATVTRASRSYSNASSRGRRPVKKRGLIGVVGTTNSPKRHRKTFSLSRDAEEEEYMDDDMRRFNERLKAMIREGKEALGATVEVVYDEDQDMEMGF